MLKGKDHPGGITPTRVEQQLTAIPSVIRGNGIGFNNIMPRSLESLAPVRQLASFSKSLILASMSGNQ